MGLFRKLFDGGAAREPARPAGPPLRVLVAEPGITVAKVIELTLQSDEITIVGTMAAALESLSTVRPQVVLSAIAFPDGDGYELCSGIAVHPLHRCPVILLPGAFERFDEDKARAAGASGVLNKPFRSADLVAAIERAVAS